MKIIPIFEDELFSIQYAHEEHNELERLMNIWTDVGYLQSYAKINNVADIYKFIQDILHDAEEVQDCLEKIFQSKHPYGFYFEPLQASERKKGILSLHKGKIRKNQLRLYAVKIEDNCFVITGGAIKMSQKMEDHPDTTIALKIKQRKKLSKPQWSI